MIYAQKCTSGERKRCSEHIIRTVQRTLTVFERALITPESRDVLYNRHVPVVHIQDSRDRARGLRRLPDISDFLVHAKERIVCEQCCSPLMSVHIPFARYV